MAASGEPPSDTELELIQRFAPRTAWSIALGMAQQKREREQRALTAAELAELRRFYPDGDYTVAEAQLLYEIGVMPPEYVIEYDPLPPWEQVEAELSVEPVAATEARLLKAKLQLAERALQNSPQATKGEPGRPRLQVTGDTLLGLLERGLERARSTGRRGQPSYDAIADEFGLKRDWITPIVKWAEKHQRQAREAIASREIPSRFSAYLSD